MSFSNKLTDLYHFLDKSNQNLQFIYAAEFREYFFKDFQNFVEVVFTYGFEIRDLEVNSINKEVEFFIELINEGMEKFKEDIQNDNEGKVKINIGLINIYLYFCQREPLKISPSLSISGDFIPPTYKTFSNIKADIDLSVGYLQKALRLATETIDIAKGIYLYNTIRLFEYIFSVFEYYKVDNDNVPIDLDSFYVFNDQLDNDEFWNELTRQIKIKYDIK